MNKKLPVILLLFALCLALTGCKSTLRPALEEYARKTNVEELSLSSLLDEENGFHFGDIHWGMTLDQATKANGFIYSKILGYGPNNIYTYETDLRIKVLGRQSDSSSVTTILDNSECYMVSFVFQRDDKHLNTEMPEQKMFEEYLPKLKEAFGEPADYREDVKTQEKVSSLTKCYVWEKTTSDGKKTELQWSAAYVSGAEEPSLVTLGVVWYHEGLEEAKKIQESMEQENAE